MNVPVTKEGMAIRSDLRGGIWTLQVYKFIRLVMSFELFVRYRQRTN